MHPSCQRREREKEIAKWSHSHCLCQTVVTFQESHYHPIAKSSRNENVEKGKNLVGYFWLKYIQNFSYLWYLGFSAFGVATLWHWAWQVLRLLRSCHRATRKCSPECRLQGVSEHYPASVRPRTHARHTLRWNQCAVFPISRLPWKVIEGWCAVGPVGW